MPRIQVSLPPECECSVHARPHSLLLATILNFRLRNHDAVRISVEVGNVYVEVVVIERLPEFVRDAIFLPLFVSYPLPL